MNSYFSQFISWLFIGCNMQFQETGLETIFCAMWCRVETQILENCQKFINCCSERFHIELVEDKERFCKWVSDTRKPFQPKVKRIEKECFIDLCILTLECECMTFSKYMHSWFFFSSIWKYLYRISSAVLILKRKRLWTAMLLNL